MVRDPRALWAVRPGTQRVWREHHPPWPLRLRGAGCSCLLGSASGVRPAPVDLDLDDGGWSFVFLLRVRGSMCGLGVLLTLVCFAFVSAADEVGPCPLRPYGVVVMGMGPTHAFGTVRAPRQSPPGAPRGRWGLPTARGCISGSTVGEPHVPPPGERPFEGPHDQGPCDLLEGGPPVILVVNKYLLYCLTRWCGVHLFMHYERSKI